MTKQYTNIDVFTMPIIDEYVYRIQRTCGHNEPIVGFNLKTILNHRDDFGCLVCDNKDPVGIYLVAKSWGAYCE